MSTPLKMLIGVLIILGYVVAAPLSRGLWRKSSLRWPAPISALGTLAFWIMAASGE